MEDVIQRVAVVGAGYMGSGIARRLAASGIAVMLTDATSALAAAARDRVLDDVRRETESGLLPAGTADTVADNLATAGRLEDAVAGADLVEEVVPENVDLKREVLSQISVMASPHAVLGSNTSTIPVHRMADAVHRPERFLVIHWSNPAHLVPGVELVLGEHTDPAVLPPVQAMLGRAGWEGAVVGDGPGFVLNRLQYALVREALLVVAEGHASAGDVDTVLRTTLGFRMALIPPLAMLDMAGLDVYAKGFAILEEALGPRFAIPQVLADAVADDRLGMKNGRGLWADYPPETLDAITAWRATAYTRMAQLLTELGPAPVPRAQPARPAQPPESGGTGRA